MHCSGCGKDIPFAGKVCPYCHRDKGNDQELTMTAIACAALGGFAGYAIDKVMGAIIGFLVGAAVGTVVGMILQGQRKQTSRPPEVRLADSAKPTSQIETTHVPAEMGIESQLRLIDELAKRGIIGEAERIEARQKLLTQPQGGATPLPARDAVLHQTPPRIPEPRPTQVSSTYGPGPTSHPVVKRKNNRRGIVIFSAALIFSLVAIAVAIDRTSGDSKDATLADALGDSRDATIADGQPEPSRSAVQPSNVDVPDFTPLVALLGKNQKQASAVVGKMTTVDTSHSCRRTCAKGEAGDLWYRCRWVQSEVDFKGLHLVLSFEDNALSRIDVKLDNTPEWMSDWHYALRAFGLKADDEGHDCDVTVPMKACREWNVCQGRNLVSVGTQKFDFLWILSEDGTSYFSFDDRYTWPPKAKAITYEEAMRLDGR